MPIFITGIYRSGTTLVSRILNNHPDLSVTYDSVHFMRFSYNMYNPIQSKENYSRLVKEIQKRIWKRWNMSLDADDVITRIESEGRIDYAIIYDSIMQVLLLGEKKSARWGEKTNVCWGQIPDFLKMFPKGKTIHVIRDPRDVLSSYKHMTDEPGLRYLDSAFASLHSFHSVHDYQNTLSKSNYYCLKYETLVGSAEEELRHLAEFLEIEYTPVLLDYTKFTDRGGQNWTGESSFDRSIEGISNKPVGRWKEKINSVELFFMEMILREQMVYFGYELSASLLDKDEWDKLYGILQDDFIKERYDRWLKTGRGMEAYPSDPVYWAKKEMESESR